MGLNWLITGGCGFIGRNLVENLINEGGHYIRIIDNLSVGTLSDLSQVCCFGELPPKKEAFSTVAPGVEVVVGDILDQELAVFLLEGIDVVVHLAANTGVGPSVKNPRKDCETNIIGTLNYLEAAKKHNIKRFIFASSGAPVGECEPPIHEELPPHPVSPYGASKLAGEAYCSAYFKTFGVETVALRFGNVYGPYSSRKSSVVAQFIKNVMKKEPITIYGDGSQTRDFIFIQDLIRAIRSSASGKNIGGEIFQIATNQETTVNYVAQVVLSLFKKRGLVDYYCIEKRSPRLGDVQRNFSNTDKAKQLLNWNSTVSLEEGVEKTINWFMQNKESLELSL